MRGGSLRCAASVVAAVVGITLAPREAAALDPGRAITQYVARTYTADDGLPQNTVYAMAQTPDGYLWMGTQDGLARFDGVRFVVFDATNTPELAESAFIESLAVDPSGALWIGTRRGVLRYDGRSFRRWTERDGLVDAHVLQVIATAATGTWVRSGAALQRLSGDRFEAPPEGLPPALGQTVARPDGTLLAIDQLRLYEVDSRGARPAAIEGGDDGVAAIDQEPDGTLWVATYSELIRHREGTVERVSRGETAGKNAVWLRQDGGGNLWMVGLNGAARLGPRGLERYTREDGLPIDDCFSVFEDTEKNLWIGTNGGGVQQLSNGKVIVYGKREGLPDDLVWTTFAARDGAVWAGTASGVARIQGDRVDGVLTAKDGLPAAAVYGLDEDREGRLWAATRAGPARLEGGRFRAFGDADGYTAQRAHSVLVDSSGRVWLGGLGTLVWYDGERFTPFPASDMLGRHIVLALAEDHDGAVWIGIEGNGLLRWKDGAATALHVADGLSDENVDGITVDVDGTLWIATDHGLDRLKDGHFVQALHAAGLYDDAIWSVLVDGDRLFLPSTKGIMSLEKGDFERLAARETTSIPTRRLDRSDGMRSPECNAGAPAAARRADGALFFPTIKGVVRVDPARLGSNAVAPPVVIESVLADRVLVPLAARIDLGPDARDLEITYSAPSFTAPARVAFRYRLEGFDDHWVDALNRRTAYYTNLPKGDYVFRVEARNEDGAWNDAGGSLALRRAPRFHETIPFYVACALAIAVAGFGAYRLRTRNLRRQARRLEDEVRRQTGELRAQAAELAELDKQKTRFFQNISHELRTPLTLILNPLDQLRRDLPLDERVDVAARNARRLLRLVNQLLEFQKLSAGKRQMKLAPIDLARLLPACAEFIAPSCREKGIELRVDAGSAPAALAEVDALEKIVFNYLSNALKYTPRGGVVELGAEPRGEHRARIWVRDTGPGIDAAGRQRLFKVFSQVDDAATRELEGTGLGLALAKELAQAMNGEVGVETAPGKGSTFFADLPRAPRPADTSEPYAISARASAEPASARMRVADSAPPPSSLAATRPDSALVLVVDDLPDMRRLVRASLGKAGYRTATASNGARALELASSIKPDVIITDWMMPILTGPELISRLKNDPELAGIPVILLTAKSDEESKHVGVAIGADAFLGKPFDDEELTSTVRNLVQLKAKERQVEQLNRHLAENVLKRYLPPALVDDIVAGRVTIDQEPEATVATILFCDMVGFTRLSADLHAVRTGRLLNEYLTAMARVVFAHGGTVDKFIGDGIMVIFGAPLKLEVGEQVRRAAECARGMQDQVRAMRATWAELGVREMRIRIGIHHGPVVVGNFGDARRSDYTAIGPTVNLASRIEGACAPGEVFLSHEAASHLAAGAVTPAGTFELKGIAEPVELHKLVREPRMREPVAPVRDADLDRA